MGRRFFIDVETVPPAEEYRPAIKPALIRQLCPRALNLCADEQFRLLALHAEYGRVLAIGVLIEQDHQVIRCGVLGRDRGAKLFHLDEARTLRGFWKLLSDFDSRRDLIIGHNIMDFDLPFLYKRSRINRIHPGVLLNFARYRHAPIYDTMREWAHWDPRAGLLSLSHLAYVLKVGMTKTEGMDGGRVYDEFLAGNHELIAEYCLQDVRMVRAVYYRMVFPEGPEPEETG
jgi:3'-5' exonuclease